jgi:hypothetical protein
MGYAKAFYLNGFIRKCAILFFYNLLQGLTA